MWHAFLSNGAWQSAATGAAWIVTNSLLPGPLIGAFVGEIAFARKHPHHAAISGVGSIVGTLAGMGFKMAVGALMIGWFFLDVFLFGK